jgi:hypothetical protein
MENGMVGDIFSLVVESQRSDIWKLLDNLVYGEFLFVVAVAL